MERKLRAEGEGPMRVGFQLFHGTLTVVCGEFVSLIHCIKPEEKSDFSCDFSCVICASWTQSAAQR